MGEHRCKIGVKGNAYKASQRQTEVKRGRYKLLAKLTEKWLINHGYVKGENGRWRLKP